MNLQRAALLAAVVLGASACDDDEGVIIAPNEARAGIRYVNAVPDTISLDFRAVDVVENNPYVATQFREIKQAVYTPVQPGSRRFRVFPNSTNIAVTSQPLTEATIDLQANTNYTILHTGFARAGQTPAQNLVVRPDTAPSVPAGQIAVRVIHAGVGLGNVDVYISASGTGALPATPTFANVPYLRATPYAFFATGATLNLRATATGSTTVIATRALPVGEAGTPSLDPLPGSSVAGSVFTVYIFPRSVAGSAAPQTAAFATPAFSEAVPDVLLRTRPTQ